MEQTDHHQNLQSLTQFTRYQFLKKIIQLLLSVSVFSLLLSNCSRFSFLHAFSFSTVPFQLFTHTIDKNYIFLLCNGLLVFVAKFSGSISSSSSPKNNHSSYIHQPVKNYYDYQPLVLEEKVALTEKEQDEETHQDEAEENDNGFLIAMEEEKESDEAFVQEDYHDQGEVTEFDDKFPVLDDQQDDDGDHEDEEENEMLSIEELNKKFEEFIRKMKEEIRIEAQEQLVMAN